MLGDMRRYLSLVLFVLSMLWITANVYLLPFHIWTAGVVYPWFITKGLTLYKDVMWIRMPLDMFLLSGWYRIFGASGQAYQLFIWFVLILLSGAILWIRWTEDQWVRFTGFLFFNIFLFPIFINTEVGEILVGLGAFLLFAAGTFYIRKRTPSWAFATGLAAGFVAITKQNASMVAGIFYVVLLFEYTSKKIRIRDGLRNIGVYTIGLFLPVTVLLIYFASKNALGDFFRYSVFMVIGPYRGFSLLTRGDGEIIEGAYGLVLIPLLLFWKKLGLKRDNLLWIVLLILALVPSLLPSFLSYRAFTSFCIVAVAAGYSLRYLVSKNASRIAQLIIVLSFVGYIAATSRYTASYVGFVQDNGVQAGQYLTDYTVNERTIADWIRSNTLQDDRVMIYGSEIMYVWTDRLPINKYTNFTPFVLQPFDQTSKIFTDNPPKALVFDEAHPDYSRGLSQWPFLTYMRKNYQEVMRFDSLVLYQLKKE